MGRAMAAKVAGVPLEQVTLHVTLLGGGFGRKSKPDYAAEAAILAKKLGKPVKVVWTREDDIHHDFYHAAAAVYHKAVVDAKGKPTAWLHRSVFQPIGSTFGAPGPLPFELDLGLNDVAYDVPNIRAENTGADAHVRIGWFRAVTNNFPPSPNTAESSPGPWEAWNWGQCSCSPQPPTSRLNERR